MDENIKSFLDKIHEIGDKKIEVDFLSTGKSGESIPLTFKQQKDLISTIADGPVGALKFQKILNQIAIDNTGDNLLKSIDRLPIILKLRSNSIGDSIKVGDGEVKIQEILDKIFEKPRIIQSDVILGDLKVEVQVPLITYENQIIQATIDILKRDKDELGKNIGNIYTYEIVKYVKSVEFGEDSINFNEIPIKDRVKIVDSLPISLNKRIIEFIQDIKKIENEWLTVEVNGESKTIEIDVSFFDN